jgi:translation elongation factor EF-G
MREQLLDKASMFSDELTEAILMESVTEDVIKQAVRKATLARKLTPVFMGSAFKNQGVQRLLDGVLDYLPAPDEVENIALDIDNDQAPVASSSPIPKLRSSGSRSSSRRAGSASSPTCACTRARSRRRCSSTTSGRPRS